MASSTSHSEPRIPALAIRLLLAALAAWAVGAVYTVKVNPEVAFFRHVHEAKRAWESTLPATNRILFVAGSSCMTSIDPVQLRDRHGIVAMNLGLGAGMGPRFLARYALDRARPGDRLVLSFEEGLLTGPIGWESLGVQFAAATGRPDLLDEPGSFHWPRTLLALRPGGYHAFTLLGKAVLRQPWYRYSAEEVRPGGWHEVAARRTVVSPGPGPDALSPAARTWLRELRTECERRGMTVVYTPPWLYGAEAQAEAMREANRRFLADIGTILPVLRDDEFGVHTDLTHYADTVAHPTGEGARINTDRVARLVKA
jgi:hypothetical protein